MTPRRVLQSDYMHFAKFGASARYNLASSGIADCVLSDLVVDTQELALHGPNASGYAPLIEVIASRFEIPVECVTTPGGGCSFANHLAMASMIDPGDEVLIEDPTYELLHSALGYLQARPVQFARRPEKNWRLEPDVIASRLTDRTRLVVLSNLHNPSGAHTSPETIAAIAESAARVGASVLVDEVYLELLFQDGKAFTAFRPDGNVIVTSSLTKAYGLSGLRCGWILAPADLTRRMKRLNDLYGVAPPHIAERLSIVAFDRLEALRKRAGDILDQNRASYREYLGDHPALEQVQFDHGTTVFPRLRREDGDSLFQRLTGGFETSVVPGRYFGRPDHIRVGLGGDPSTTRIGLQRLADALDSAPGDDNQGQD